MLACLQKTCLICLFFVTQAGRGNEAVLYNRRHTTKKSNLEATALPFTSSHENKKDKRKEIDVPCLSLPPPTVMKDKGKAIAEPFSSLSPETRQEKGKRAVVLSTPVSGNKKTKGIHEPFMTSSPQKVKSKAQAISLEHFPSDEKAAEETFGASTGSCSSLKKTRGKGMVDASVFSCPTLPKKRTNRSLSLFHCFSIHVFYIHVILREQFFPLFNNISIFPFF